MKIATLAVIGALVAPATIAQAQDQSATASAPIPPAPPAPPPAPAPVGWTGTAGLAMILLTGNAETLTLSGTLGIQRAWELWKLALKASGAYGRARPATGGLAEVVAEAAQAELRGDRSVTERVSLFLLTGAETNHVKSN